MLLPIVANGPLSGMPTIRKLSGKRRFNESGVLGKDRRQPD